MTDKDITFSVEPVLAEDRSAIHLYFGDHTRIQIGSLNDFNALIRRLEFMVGEITESHRHQLQD